MPNKTKKILNFLINNIFIVLLSFFVLSFSIIVVDSLLPGDTATALLGKSATSEALSKIREELNLNATIYEKYKQFLLSVLNLDFGISYTTKEPVSKIIGYRIFMTLKLALVCIFIAVPLSFLLVVFSFYSKIAETILRFKYILIMGIPEFFLSYFFIYVFSNKLNLFSPIYQHTEYFLDYLENSILAILTITVVTTAHMARMINGIIKNETKKPYTEFVAIKGLSKIRQLVFHNAKNSIGYISSIMALNIAYMIVGIVVVEKIFLYPGIGQLLIDSVFKKDLPVVQACCLIFSVVYMMLMLISNLINLLNNPEELYKTS